MPPYKMSRLGARLLEVIPFEWTPAHEVMNKIIPEIAPGKALRMYENNYRRHRLAMKTEPELDPNPLTGEAAIRSGAKSIINHQLVSLRRQGYLESEGRGRSRRLRQVERKFFGTAYCCLHGGNCGKSEPAAVEQPDDDEDWETPWTW